MKSDASPLLMALDEGGYRLTQPRQAVVQLIASREGHFTSAQLLSDAKARRTGIGRATVFRALELFTELGALERLDLPDGDHAYVRCRPVHHHHVVCSACGRAAEVEDHGIQGIVDDIAWRTGYVIDAHRLELYGLCRGCQATPTP